MGIRCFKMMFVTERGAKIIENKQICGTNITEEEAMKIVEIIKPKLYLNDTPILIETEKPIFLKFEDYN